MRFLFNTRHNDAGTRVCIRDLSTELNSLGLQVTLNDWSAYKTHDVVVFMGYDNDIEYARRINPAIKVVLADPKLSNRELTSAAIKADLLLVSSVEQRDVFLRLNSNVYVYYMFPAMSEQPRTHFKSARLVLAYHGNRVHLDSMRPVMIPALGALTESNLVELICIYNIAALGRADLRGLEATGTKVTHLQWNEETLVDMLAKADIGIMPNELPIRDKQDALARTAFSVGNYAYEPFDHLVRYKASTNPGRLLPFVCAGLPVVADFCPSASQFIRDGESGFVVSSPHGWHFALSRLAESAELRQTCADRLRELVISVRQKQPQKFLELCENLTQRIPPKLAGLTTIEEEQRLFHNFPRPNETPLTWLRRQWKKHINH